MNDKTLQAVVSLAALLLVNMFAGIGLALDEGAAMDIASFVVIAVATVYSCWRNHNFTGAAQEAQKFLDAMKKVDRNKGQVPDDMKGDDFAESYADWKEWKRNADDQER